MGKKGMIAKTRESATVLSGSSSSSSSGSRGALTKYLGRVYKDSCGLCDNRVVG
jgi:hypothetical protein